MIEQGVLEETPLPRMAMVLHLETVVPFKACSASEIVRLASIARQVEFRPEDVVYHEGDPPRALYSLVTGQVQLSDGGASVLVDPGRTFGMLEILTGRLRRRTATATAAARALSFEAEDFLDLLSNNVEIVRALFRQALEAPEGPMGGLL
jgi:CRP-like cAMP-binding protein